MNTTQPNTNVPRSSTALPPGWRSVIVGDLLTPAQVEVVTSLLNAHQTDPTEAVPELKRYLGRYRLSLEAQGVDSDYLAYALVHMAIRGGAL